MKDSNGIEIKPGGELSYTIEYRYPSDQFPGSFERRKETYRYPVSISTYNVLIRVYEVEYNLPLSGMLSEGAVILDADTSDAESYIQSLNVVEEMRVDMEELKISRHGYIKGIAYEKYSGDRYFSELLWVEKLSIITL